MENKNRYLSTLAVLPLLWTCDKGPELTPITQEGKNTFSCKVNGKVWIPDGRGSIFVYTPPITGGFYNNSIDDTLRIWIISNADNGEEIHLNLKSIVLGERKLNSNTQPKGASLFPSNYGLFRNVSGSEFITSSNCTGTVILIKADSVSGIIAGTFEFTASDPKGNLIKITNGRFDINSRTL